MTDKSSRWAFTAYEQQYGFFKTMPPGVHKWGWNVEECPETKREHYQGWMQLKQQQRFSWMRKQFPGLHVEIPRNWEALLQYCQKEDTRKVGTTPTVELNDIPTKYGYAEEVAKRLGEYYFHNSNTAFSGTLVLERVDAIVRADIRNGRRGVEWIASNPDWKVVWKAYGMEMVACWIKRTETDRQTDNEIISPVEHNPDAPQTTQEEQSSAPSPPPDSPDREPDNWQS